MSFDLPGVDPDSIDLDVERNAITVKAERTSATGDGVEMIAAVRPRGVFSRQLFLGDNRDTDNVGASYDAGVLTLLIPFAERAKPPQDHDYPRNNRPKVNQRLSAGTSR